MNEKTKNRIVPILLIIVGVIFVVLFPRLRAAAGGFLDAVSPLYSGLFLAFVLNIPCRALEKLFGRFIKSPLWIKILSVLITYILFVGVIVVFMTVLLPQLSRSVETLYENMPAYIEKIEQVYINVAGKLGIEQTLAELLERYNAEIMQAVGDITKTTGSALLSFGVGLGKGIFRFLLAAIVSIYVICGKGSLKTSARAVIKRLCGAERGGRVLSFFAVSSVKLSSFIGGQVFDAVLLGALCALGMVIIGLPFATLIGIIVAVTALVPIVGAWAGGALSALIIAMENPMQAAVFIIFLIALQQLENNLIYPKIVGDALGISGLWVLAAVTLGGALFGVWGMLLGAPVFSIIKHYVDIWVENPLYNK